MRAITINSFLSNLYLCVKQATLKNLIGPDCAYRLYKKFDIVIENDIIGLKSERKRRNCHGKINNI